MHRISKLSALVLVLAALLTLSGCYSGNIDQYFSLPKPSEEYQQLQQLIDREIAGGSGYAAPTRGSYRQSVQLMDLDDDGTAEALAFLRGADSLLKINVYALSGSEYRQVLSLTEKGRSIGRVDFVDMDRDGRRDLVITCQISTGLGILSVYSLQNWSGELLRTAGTSCWCCGMWDRIRIWRICTPWTATGSPGPPPRPSPAGSANFAGPG